jgi:hypothetical protein
MRFGARIFLILVIACGQGETYGQQTASIKRLSGEVNFDGIPGEEAWNGQEYFPLIMNQPNYGNEPGEKSEVMIAYDDEYLWIGARLFSKDPSKIMATSKKRDEMAKSSDSFGIIFDTYNDNENALAFFTMPTAARIDYAISGDGVMTEGGGSGGGMGNDPNNMSWNTFWDVKTSRDDKGWYVEMRIYF